MSPATFRLIVRTGPSPGMIFDLTKDVTVLGRDVTNDIVLGDAEVSRQHSRLTRTPGGYVLEDLGSTNGTFVNGERLLAPRVLSAGDLMGLSEKVTLSFDVVTPEAAATVMGPAYGRAAPPPTAPEPPMVRPSARQAPPPPSPAYASPSQAAPAQGGGSRRWLLAGCGCILLLGACVALVWFLDRYYPDILYAPLRILGIGG